MRIFLGLIFLVSGWIKMSDMASFQGAVSQYQLLPALLIPAFSRLLPSLELAVGLALVVGLWLEGAWLWSELLYYVFFLGVFSVRLRGLEIHCGCFGKFATTITWWHALGCLAVGLLLTGRRKGVLLNRSRDSTGEGLGAG